MIEPRKYNAAPVEITSGRPPGWPAELVGITRPGGRIVLIDTDWGLHAIHGADPTLTATIVSCWTDSAGNGLAGRGFPPVHRAGLHDPSLSPKP